MLHELETVVGAEVSIVGEVKFFSNTNFELARTPGLDEIHRYGDTADSHSIATEIFCRHSCSHCQQLVTSTNLAGS